MGRLCIGQGRAGMKRGPDPIKQPINQPSDLSQKIPGRTQIETGKTKPSTYQGSHTFHKQHEWQDDKK